MYQGILFPPTKLRPYRPASVQLPGVVNPAEPVFVYSNILPIA